MAVANMAVAKNTIISHVHDKLIVTSSSQDDQSGPAAELRQSFAGTRTLNNSINQVVRMNRSLHSQRAASLVVAVPIQDTVAQFTQKDAPKMMKPLWKSYWFRNTNDLLHFHYTDLAVSLTPS
ncbi:hypothetical protein Egran_01493 [Elaphomyces granulatus]|uniref:Uncharacterized protein n=1 Tax=Elaphomyces granulatus TaxID=519963 RepID=A0A232M322_9EURO|nr:hypothetical protein Egran_01493 [Elaphomyces granulatus]